MCLSFVGCSIVARIEWHIAETFGRDREGRSMNIAIKMV